MTLFWPNMIKTHWLCFCFCFCFCFSKINIYTHMHMLKDENTILWNYAKNYWKDKQNRRKKRVLLTLRMVLEEGWATVVTIGVAKMVACRCWKGFFGSFLSLTSCCISYFGFGSFNLLVLPFSFSHFFFSPTLFSY